MSPCIGYVLPYQLWLKLGPGPLIILVLSGPEDMVHHLLVDFGVRDILKRKLEVEPGEQGVDYGYLLCNRDIGIEPGELGVPVPSSYMSGSIEAVGAKVYPPEPSV